MTTGSTSARDHPVRPEDILPDGDDHAQFDGMPVRKGTVAAFLQNAMRWSEPSTPGDIKEQIGREIVRSLPALHALKLLDVLEPKDERLRKLIAENS